MSTIAEKQVVHTRIVKIGNSQGIRIPKWLLEQSGLGETVELEVQDDHIVIRPARPRHPREGWEEQFRAAVAERGDEGLLDPDLTGYSDFDREEWEW